MTRFARAKGSKASNERVPEEATSWREMKNQLQESKNKIEDSKKQKAAESMRKANYSAFLKERDEENKKNTKWADFPETSKFPGNLVLLKSPNTSGKVKKNKSPKNLKKSPKGKQPEDDDSEDSEDGQPDVNLEDSDDESIDGFKELVSKIDKVLDKGESDKDEDNKSSDEQETVQEGSDEQEFDDKNEDNDSLHEQESDQEQDQKSSDEPESGSGEEEVPEEVSSKVEPKILQVKKQKQKKPLLNIVVNRESRIESEKFDTKTDDSDTLESKKKGNKRKNSTSVNAEGSVKKVRPQEPNKKTIDLDSLTEKERIKLEKKLARRARQVEKKRIKKAEAKKLAESGEQPPVKLNKKEKQNNLPKNQLGGAAGQKEKNLNKQAKSPAGKKGKASIFEESYQGKDVVKFPKKDDSKEYKRRKPERPSKMIINGKEVEIGYFDGFPLKREDVDQLKQLRKQMISKSLPRSEITRTLQLERRRREKAFSREKKNVCFNCRKSGHVISECPNLREGNELVDKSGTGICYKCGSTEHTHFECKVVRDQVFKFATCFICNEQGHISRQCPDNSRGMYPKGGACRECGDVTHLKKDCPKYQTQQQNAENKLDIGTYDGGNPDSLPNRNVDFNRSVNGSTRNKVVKF